MMPIGKLCRECRHYDVMSAGSGMCRRYPEAISVTAGNWCGEHQPREVAVEKPEPVKRKPGYYWLHLRFQNNGECDRIAEWCYRGGKDDVGGMGFYGTNHGPRIDPKDIAFVDERRIERSPA